MDWKLILDRYQEWDWPSKGMICNASATPSTITGTTSDDGQIAHSMLSSSDELSLFFSPLNEKQASDLSIKAKITPKQIHLMNELLKLKELRSFLYRQQKQPQKDEDKEVLERHFRLMVKRRLKKDNREELIALPTKEDQKAMLAKLFDEEMKQFNRILPPWNFGAKVANS